MLVRLVADDNAAVRDEARFICKKHSIIKDFPEFYRQQIFINPVPGVLIGLGETGNKKIMILFTVFLTMRTLNQTCSHDCHVVFVKR